MLGLLGTLYLKDLSKWRKIVLPYLRLTAKLMDPRGVVPRTDTLICQCSEINFALA